MPSRLVAFAIAVSLLFWASPGAAQAPTGTISGRVISADGAPLPDVSVSVMSDSLQGVRTAATSANGDFIVPLLPPGEYAVAFEAGAFQTVRRVQGLAGTQTVRLEVTMSLSPVEETVTVVGQAEPFVQTAQLATNFKQDLVATLPTNRSLEAAVLLAPSVHATGPRGAFSIAGAQSYENLYTLNGTVIVENLRGSPYPLYIEDALQEVMVATAGLSAEFGRFGGGMVSAITKSGGDVFSGSFRTSFNNERWRSTTPFREQKSDKTIPTYEATLGGPVLRQRLWFFGAARILNQEVSRQTVGTNIPYIRTNDEKRYEGKLTYSFRANHSVQGSYIDIDQIVRNNNLGNVMDLESLFDQRQPADMLALRYGGVLRDNLSVEAQYSARHLTLDMGAPTRDLIRGTLLLDRSRNFRYWSPTFCGVCEDEKRDNNDLILKASYFLSTSSGAHNLVFGYDRFNDKIFQNAHASGSDYRIMGTSTVTQGSRVFSQFLPGSTIIQYNPVEISSMGSNLRMHSLFVNDSWRWTPRLSLSLGLRWDKNQAEDGGGAVVANKWLLSPRLGATWDPEGAGRWTISGSFARYVMPMTSNVAASTTAAGNAATFQWLYLGPPVNANPSGPLMSTEAAIQQVFDWFTANGGTSRPPLFAFVPGTNVRIPRSLRSPHTDEYAGGTGRRIGTRGTIRIDGVFRRYRDFYSQRVDLSTGRVFDRFGTPFDLVVIENTNNVKRRYTGLTMQATFQVRSGVEVGGNYTLSRARGNFDGETASAGPIAALADAYSEYKDPAWNSPHGDLSIDQRHRARLWGTYVAPTPASAGALTIGVLQQIGSGVPYAALGQVNAAAFVVNPGYVTPQGPGGTVDYYFTRRGAFRTETTYRTDLSVNYAFRIRRAGGVQPELFFHGELLNLFNQFQVCACGGSIFNDGGATDLSTIGQSVRTAVTAPAALRPFNPFLESPTRGVHWDLNSKFGTPLSALAYTSPRTFRFSMGVRF